MKVVAFNGSPRKGGNTEILIQAVFKELEQAGVECELVQVGGKPVRGCVACSQCFVLRDGRCVQKNDIVNDCIDKMVKADGIILGSPTYFTDVTSEMKALIDRAGFVSIANGGLLRRKVGAAVVAVRRGGELQAFDTMNHLFLIAEMVVVGSCYWNMGVGLNPGDVRTDEEGMETMRVLGQNMAWALGRLRGAA